MDAARIVADSLLDTGLNLAASCGIAAYDHRAPRGLRSRDLMPRARGVVVVGSAGRELWAQLRGSPERDAAFWSRADPLDMHVAEALDRADLALARAGVGSRRFEPTLRASHAHAIDFRALGELTGLGSMGPFGIVIHPVHGPWWALRGAWLVDVEVAEPTALPAPCAGCHAPCLGSSRPEGILLATALVRRRCIVGQDSRYTEEQIAYHYEPEETLAKLRRSAHPPETL
jgi:epoxyqueuosine reductase QueG